MAEIFQHGGDFVREEALDEIVRWFREGPHDGEVKAVPAWTFEPDEKGPGPVQKAQPGAFCIQ